MLEGARVMAIVPAFNEAKSVGRVVRTMPPIVDRIFVIDDASHDDTALAATREDDPRVEVIRHGKNQGVGAAIVTGYRRALAEPGTPRDAFAVLAGDGQMDPRDLADVVRPVVMGHAAYVKGDRFRVPTVDRAMPWKRRLGGEVFSRLTSLAIGIPISDSQCGYTALARRACAILDLDGLYTGYGYPNDLLGQLAVRGERIAEVPVRAVYAGEKSGLMLRHLPRIGWLVARAAVRKRVRRATRS